MNECINTMLSRCSVRSYCERNISEEVLKTLLKAANQSPTYGGGQQYSIIVVSDQDKKEKIYEMTVSRSGKGMSFIKKAPVFLLFVMDFHKIKLVLESENAEMKITNVTEALLVGSVDVGIAAEALSAAAESMGLGTVFVGAIRKNAKDIIDLFELPPHTFPILGLTIGYPSEKANRNITPRLPLETLVHYNVYNDSIFKKSFKKYNELMTAHYQSRGQDNLTWSQLMTRYYSQELYAHISKDLQSQKFFLK